MAVLWHLHHSVKGVGGLNATLACALPTPPASFKFLLFTSNSVFYLTRTSCGSIFL